MVFLFSGQALAKTLAEVGTDISNADVKRIALDLSNMETNIEGTMTLNEGSVYVIYKNAFEYNGVMCDLKVNITKDYTGETATMSTVSIENDNYIFTNFQSDRKTLVSPWPHKSTYTIEILNNQTQ